MQSVTIIQLEAIINRAREQFPPKDGVLPLEVRLLAKVYGLMIYRRLSTMALGEFSEITHQLLVRFDA